MTLSLRALAALLLFAMVLPQNASARPVHESLFVPIGGIAQWITITGSDDANPVLLVLHGGPGDALSPFAAGLFAGWDKDFTLVQWDQRGAGRTYGKNGASIEASMTMDRMTRDGIEVAQYLTRHLGKPKIILTGGSWGSILGVTMVHARPDLFYAYIGRAQVVNWQKNLSASYAQVLQLATAAGDRENIAALKSIGPPPWKTLFPQWRIYRKAEQAYQAKIATAPDAPMKVDPAYAGAAERRQYSEAEDFSTYHFWAGRQPKSQADFANLPMAGPLNQVDLTALGPDFKIPIYIVEGEADLTAPPELARAWLDSIKAPRKQFFSVPGTGHEPSQAMQDLTHKILLEQVKPLASATAR